ncbi:CHC2 zinc finger domain-containing protein [Kitasatospora sp. NPDC048540]|uniref:CHC2 zinc finger domain-containing protein n=1 Tax=Kitasatospora sp. NPDC048540 TaxID=3155634 RepID=UPI0033F9673B
MRFSRVGDRDESGGDEKPDLGELLDHYDVGRNPLRATGMVRCPLHEDNTPSMSFNTDKGLWRCHSCGEGGDSYSLIMKKEDTDFVGARTFAATLGLAAGGAGGGGDELSGSRYARGRRLPARKGDRSGGSGYVPAWRRR